MARENEMHSLEHLPGGICAGYFGCGARPRGLSRPGGLFGFLGILVRPMQTIVSVDGDAAEHLPGTGARDSGR